MKRGNFTYSLIRYNHNRLLNESIIIGILFYFQNENKVYVTTPNKDYKNLYLGEYKESFFS